MGHLSEIRGGKRQAARRGSARTLVFIGSLTRNTPFFEPARGRGISVFVFDEATGALELLSETSGTDNPTYLAIDAKRALVYASSEVFEWHEGLVTSYAIEPMTGGLVYGNKQPTLGHLSAFVALDRAGRNLLVSNYSMQPPSTKPGRCLVVLPVADGVIGPATSGAMREGSGPVADRQERSQRHARAGVPPYTPRRHDRGSGLRRRLARACRPGACAAAMPAFDPFRQRRRSLRSPVTKGQSAIRDLFSATHGRARNPALFL